MSDITISEISTGVPQDDRSGVSTGLPGDFVQLLKPRVMSLVVFTALAGLVATPVPIHPVIGFVAILAIAVGAGASGALNMWYDADIDAIMTRTRSRPIPSGRLHGQEALAFGLVLSLLSVVTLGVVTNWLAAALLAFTIFFYAVIYTMWLKRWTPQNIVIGGAAGAFPPMVGWVAATGSVGMESILLFTIIFLWTPPHFWALALFKSPDYAAAGIPMMPNVKGQARTRLEILLYTIILVPVGVLPALLGYEGWVYGTVAIVSGALMLWHAWRVCSTRDGKPAVDAAKKLFAYSIFHLFLLFAVILVSHTLLRMGVYHGY